MTRTSPSYSYDLPTWLTVRYMPIYLQQNKALCGSWAPHRAGRTEYGVTNDDVENLERQSIHFLVL